MKPHEGGSSIHYFQSGSEQCMLQNVGAAACSGLCNGDSSPDRAETLARWEASSANNRLEYFQLHCETFNTEF